MNETQRDEPAESKPAPSGELNFAATRSFQAFPNALAQKLLLAFACFFPLVTGVDRMTSDHFKFYALAIFSVVIGALLFRQIWLRGFSFWKNRITRLAFFIAILLSAYAAWLLGFTVATFLIPAVFFVIIPVLCQSRLKGQLPQNVFTFLRWLVPIVVVCCFATTHQFTALGGDDYRKTGLATFGCCVLIFLATVLFFHPRDSRTILESAMKWMLSSCFVVTIIGLLQFFFQKGFMARFFHDLLADPRSIGTLGQTNWFGTYLLLLFPMAVYQFFKNPSEESESRNSAIKKNSLFWTRSRIVWAVLCCLIYANLLTAQTRGAWVATAVFVVFLFIARPEHRRNTIRLLVLIFFVTAFLAPWKHWQILKRADTLPTEAGKAMQGSGSTGSDRFKYWKYSLRELPRHAILGSGLDTLGEIAPAGTAAPVTKAHSIFLEYAVTIGIPGLLLYLAFLWSCVRRLSRSFLHWTFRAIFITYFVQGIFIHDTIQTWPLIWFIAGICAVASLENKETQSGNFISPEKAATQT